MSLLLFTFRRRKKYLDKISVRHSRDRQDEKYSTRDNDNYYFFFFCFRDRNKYTWESIFKVIQWLVFYKSFVAKHLFESLEIVVVEYLTIANRCYFDQQDFAWTYPDEWDLNDPISRAFFDPIFILTKEICICQSKSHDNGIDQQEIIFLIGEIR